MDATTTTAPPKQPTTSDITLLAFAHGLELAMNALYTKAVAKAGKDNKPVFELFGAHHLAYAQALSGLLGAARAKSQNSSFFSAFSTAAGSGSDAELAATFLSLENAMAKTHIELLASLKSTDAANLIASISAVEGRHAAVLAGLTGKTDLALALDNAAEALTSETSPA